jgi:hypothetical protein
MDLLAITVTAYKIIIENYEVSRSLSYHSFWANIKMKIASLVCSDFSE